MEASRAHLARHETIPLQVLVYECCPAGDMSLATFLEREGRVVTSCHDGSVLLDSVVAHRPDAIVAVLRRECQGDFGLLHLLKRVAPNVPIIFVAADATLKLERVARTLEPFYYAIAPVDLEEIEAAVGAALERRRQGPRLEAEKPRP